MREASTDLSIRKSDIVLIVFIVFFCIVLFVVSFASSETGSSVFIYKDGVLFAEKTLASDSVTDVDGLLSVVIKNGTVYVENAVCPNGDCMRTTARFSGDSIICLPNRIMIKITGKGETDAVSG